MIPGIALYIIWRWVFQPDVGLLNQLLGAFGVPHQLWILSPKQVMLSLALILGGLSCSKSSGSGKYVASASREPYHRLSCEWAKKISAGNAVYYESKQAAEADGHRPCKVCRP